MKATNAALRRGPSAQTFQRRARGRSGAKGSIRFSVLGHALDWCCRRLADSRLNQPERSSVLAIESAIEAFLTQDALCTADKMNVEGGS